MNEESKYLGMAPMKVEGKSFYEGCMSGCEGVHLSNQIKKLTEEKDLLSREFSLSIELGLMWMDRIEKLEKALKSIIEIPNSDAAQGIMKTFAREALGVLKND
jgi:hypothetical protein